MNEAVVIVDSNFHKSVVRSSGSHSIILFFYSLLLIFLFASISIFFMRLLANDQLVWKMYHQGYVIMLLLYTWYTFILLFIEDLKKKRYRRYGSEKISVIMPCYNENPTLLRNALNAVIAANGNKQIIVIDDGSTNGVNDVLHEYAKRKQIIVRTFSHNKGKRSAVHYAVKNLIGDSQYVVMMDSDTLLDKDALIRIVEPLSHPRVGAASGEVRLFNERQNWLTRMTGAYYWTALNMQRKAQSSLGMVSCCSGCIAAYRAEPLKKVIDQFMGQMFFGEPCTYSEDRHLTNLMLRQGYNVVYRPEAIAYTYSPYKVKDFLKQQQRWRRGFIKESLFGLTFLWKKKPLLFLEILLWDLITPILSLAMVLALCISLVLNPAMSLTLLLSWAVISLIRHLPLVFRARNKLLGLFFFTIFSNLVLYWQSFYALFTLKNTRWITR